MLYLENDGTDFAHKNKNLKHRIESNHMNAKLLTVNNKDILWWLRFPSFSKFSKIFSKTD